MSNKNNKNGCSGFSLLELAIVLFILAILLGGILVPLAVRQEQVERDDTEAELEKIRDVLMGYTISNGKLPCPDCRDNTGNCAGVAAAEIDDGREDMQVSGGVDVCVTEIGYLPWVDLGVNSGDAWGNKYTYIVSGCFADEVGEVSGSCEEPPPASSFTLSQTGDVDVHNDLPSPPSTLIAEDLPVLVVSHGKNFVENNPSNYELENLDNDTDFIQRDFSQSAGEEFDDLVIWISPHSLRLKMVEAGLLP